MNLSNHDSIARRFIRSALLLPLVLLLLAADFARASEFSGASPLVPPAFPTISEDEYLATALASMPADARRFAFTHWTRVRRQYDFAGNSRDSTREERVRYMKQVLMESQAAAVMDSRYFLFQAENWGWDSTDLVWEAQAEYNWITETSHLLRFREDFDFDALRRLLESLGFATSRYRGAAVYHVPIGEDPEWHFRSALAHHTIALLPADHLLIMAPELESVHRVLDARAGEAPALLSLPRLSALEPDLRDLAAVELRLGDNSCWPFSPFFRPRVGEAAVAQVAGLQLSAYSFVLAGHRYVDELQRDTLFIQYGEAPLATLEFPSRQHLLEAAASPFRETTYARQFRLLEAAVSDDGLMRFELLATADLRRRPGWPQTLLGWLQKQDALFASCTS